MGTVHRRLQLQTEVIRSRMALHIAAFSVSEKTLKPFVVTHISMMLLGKRLVPESSIPFDEITDTGLLPTRIGLGASRWR